MVVLIDLNRRKVGQAMTARGEERTPPPPTPPARGDSAAESESRPVIDTAAAHVAEIKSSAVQEARELISRSLQGEREAFSSTLNRSSRLTSTGDVLAGTVAEMTSALRTQVDDVIEALRALREVVAEWPEVDFAPGDAEPEHPYAGHPEPPDPQEQAVVALPEAEPPAAPDTGPAAAEPPPGRVPNAAAVNPRVEPSPELREMFRQHVTRMHDDGKPREEAERALLRFKLGHRFVEMLNEVYSSDAASADAARRG
jgi:hypothetical protein